MNQDELDKIKEKYPGISEDVLAENTPTLSVKNRSGQEVEANQVSQVGDTPESKPRAKEPQLKVSEEDFQDTVIQFAQLHGWKVCTFRKARIKIKGVETYRTPFGADGKGFPDSIFTHAKWHKFFTVEFKSTNGKLSKEQEDWWRQLILSGVPHKLWRPKHWPEIEKELSGER
jgi:hypothetical protein